MLLGQYECSTVLGHFVLYEHTISGLPDPSILVGSSFQNFVGSSFQNFVGSSFQNLVGTGFHNLVDPGSGLIIKVSIPFKIAVFIDQSDNTVLKFK